jgi:hypothetical protein
MSSEAINARLDSIARYGNTIKEAKAALRQAKAKKRQEDRRVAAQVHALIGEAVAITIEGASEPERSAHKAYISEILDRHFRNKGSARSLLETTGWVPRQEPYGTT